MGCIGVILGHGIIQRSVVELVLVILHLIAYYIVLVS
jgi:hypothetical protein